MDLDDREAALDERRKAEESILAAGEQRDAAAEVRDVVADHREHEADLKTFLSLDPRASKVYLLDVTQRQADSAPRPTERNTLTTAKD